MSYAHVEETGGLNLGNPILKKNIFYIPIECDANGKFINKKPTTFTSAPLAYYKAVVKIKNHEILFYLKVRLDKNYHQTQIKEINLGKLSKGTYKIFYLDRNNKKTFIKPIVIKKGESPSWFPF